MLRSSSALRHLALARTRSILCNTFSRPSHSTSTGASKGTSTSHGPFLDSTEWVLIILFGVMVVTDWYMPLVVWPRGLRQDLRAALRKRNNKDYDESETYFLRAWAAAKALPPSEFNPQPYLKITGIAIALGSMLESTGRLDKAYDVYSDALSHLQDAGSKLPLSIEEHMRSVTLSCKLAEMADAMGRDDIEEENRLVWAVEVILKNVMPAKAQKDEEYDTAAQQRKQSSDGTYLDLPDWVSRTDLAAPFEALGSLYVRNGKDEYALPLFLQAVSFLIPPPPKMSPAVNRCQGAQTMSSISDLIIRVNPTNDGIAQAESWSRKALDITNDTRDKLRQGSWKWCSKTPKTEPACELALAVSLYNIGVLRAMAKDKQEAMRFLKMSFEQSQSAALKKEAAAAKEILWRVEHNLM